ncbi:MAG: DUF3857 domain-containing protein, partial [Armatimonadota bacterium]
ALPATADTAAVARLRALAPSPETLALLGYRLRLAGDAEQAVTVLRGAVRETPGSGWLHWALSQALDDDDLADAARAERKLALKHNPSIIHAALDELMDQSEELDPADYVRQMKALAARHPDSATALWLLAGAYSMAGMESDCLTTAERAFKLIGGVDSLMALMYEYEGIERTAAADKLLQDGMRANPCSEDLLGNWCEKLAERGKTAEAIAGYQRLLQIDQPLPYYRKRLADLYLARKDDAQAARTLEYVRRQCPQDADACIRLADILLEQQRTAEAVELYKTAVMLDPGNVSLRSKVKVIAGEQPVSALAALTPVEPILERAAKLRKPGNASACILLDESWGVVYPDYATEMRERLIMKVFDKAGVESYDEFSIGNPTATSRDTIERARLIKADGDIEDWTDEADGLTVSFPSLAPGDVIDVTCRIEDYPGGALNRHFWSECQFTIAGLPIELSRYILITPPDMPLALNTHGAVPEPAVTDVEGWRIRDWRVEKIPVEVSEYGAPGDRDVESWLDISTVPSWREISSWYRDLAGPRCQPDNAVRAKAAELTKDAGSEEEKIRALVDYVSQEIRYQSTPFRLSAYIPTEGKQVMREGYGDCKDKAALLAALLAAVGIKADLALLNPRSDGLTPMLPSPRFTHVINRIHTANGPLWVDATAEHQPYGMLPFEDQGVWALIVDAETGELAQTPVASATALRSDFRYELSLDDEHRLQGTLSLQAMGEMGGMLRAVVTEVPESDREMMLRAIGGKLLPGVTHDSGSLENLEARDKPMVVHLKFHADHYSASVATFEVFRLPWRLGSGEFETLFSSKERKQDLELAGAGGGERSTLRLQLPAGYTLKELPPVNERATPWGSYRISYRMDGATLIAEAERTLTALRIPAKDFPQFREFIRAFKEEEKRQIVLVKP